MNKDTINHPLEKDFLLSKVRQGNHENMEKDYGKIGQLETEQENKNFKKWGSNALKDMRLGDNYHDKEKIAPEVTTVFFTLPEAGKKKTIFQGFEFAHRQVEMKKEKGDKSQANLFIPYQVQIDYSEYSDVPKFKDNIYAKPYKDGIMLVTDVEKANHSCLALSFNEKAEFDADFYHGNVIVRMFNEVFHNFGQIDWNHKNFDNQLVFYVVVPKIVKNKAARIVFKNNIHANKLIKFFRSKPIQSLPPGKFKYFYDRTSKALQVSINLTAATQDKTLKKNEQYIYSNQQLLDAGYKIALREYSIMGTDSKINDYWKFLEAYEKKSLEEIKQEYVKDIFPLEKSLEYTTIQNLDHKDKRYFAYFKKNLLKMVILYYHTNKGTTLYDDTLINIENKTQADCLLFWKSIDLFELLFNVLNKKNFPLCIENSKIINDEDIYSTLLLPQFGHMKNFIIDKKYRYLGGPSLKEEKTFNFKYKHILEESVNNATGYLVPYDGFFELLHDPIFKGIRFREEGDLVTAVILDRNERHFVEVFSKTEVDFKYMFWNHVKHNKDYSEECTQSIYRKIAIVIRDSHVLVDREITMGAGGKRRPYGMNTDSEYNIYYYPRKRYRYKNNTKAQKDFFRESRKFSGSRVAHLRGLPADYEPSEKQKLLAKSLGWHVPPGHTFVKELTGIKMKKKETKYRHTGLNNLFYFGSNEVSEAQKINQLPDGMAFEEYCQEYVKKLGYSTKSRQNYDGGIDIRATKILDNGETEYLIAQCKKWNTPIPPGEMRAFKASCDEEQSEYKKVKIFMTSNKFSPGAREYAEKYNIKLIDGSDFINHEKA